MPKAAGKDKEMDGVEKAAILLIALGPEKSAQIFKHLKEDEIEQLTLEIANTSSVSAQTKEMVLNEFYEVCLAQQYIAEGGISYAKELLEKALGEDKAKDVISKLTASLQVRPFEFVRKTDPSQLLNFIQDEHPQRMEATSMVVVQTENQNLQNINGGTVKVLRDFCETLIAGHFGVHAAPLSQCRCRPSSRVQPSEERCSRPDSTGSDTGHWW